LIANRHCRIKSGDVLHSKSLFAEEFLTHDARLYHYPRYHAHGRNPQGSGGGDG
jgi:hypothetical protein